VYFVYVFAIIYDFRQCLRLFVFQCEVELDVRCCQRGVDFLKINCENLKLLIGNNIICQTNIFIKNILLIKHVTCPFHIFCSETLHDYFLLKCDITSILLRLSKVIPLAFKAFVNTKETEYIYIHEELSSCEYLLQMIKLQSPLSARSGSLRGIGKSFIFGPVFAHQAAAIAPQLIQSFGVCSTEGSSP